jgi:hypothetical protein
MSYDAFISYSHGPTRRSRRRSNRHWAALRSPGTGAVVTSLPGHEFAFCLARLVVVHHQRHGRQPVFRRGDALYFVEERTDETAAVRWRVDVDGLRASSCARAGRNLTAAEVDLYQVDAKIGMTLCG